MKKRTRSSLETAVLDIYHREVGSVSNRNFAHRFAASEDIVLRLDLLQKLGKHRGCVNTVDFNDVGDILISGSDDRRVILWNWEIGNVKVSFHSGHINNIFQAKFMSETDDRSIVTCAADGQVRHAQIPERGEVKTKLLGKHQGRAHKLAVEPGSPHIFYTCGEDGLVQHFDLRTGTATELFVCQPVRGNRSYMPVVNLNAIAIDPRNPNLFAVAGSDEFTRLYDIRKYKWDGASDFGQPADYFCPCHIIDNKDVGLTGLAFSDQSELLVSYNDENIYLFSRDMGLGSGVTDNFIANFHSSESPSKMDIEEIVQPKVYKGHMNRETVKGVSFFGPKCEYVVSGSDCGRMFIWRKKDTELIRVAEADKHVVNCIQSHPHTPVLASSGIESDIKIWVPKAIDKAVLPTNIGKDWSDDSYDSDDFEFMDDDSEDPSDDSCDDDDEDDDDEDDDGGGDVTFDDVDFYFDDADVNDADDYDYADDDYVDDDVNDGDCNELEDEEEEREIDYTCDCNDTGRDDDDEYDDGDHRGRDRCNDIPDDIPNNLDGDSRMHD